MNDQNDAARYALEVNEDIELAAIPTAIKKGRELFLSGATRDIAYRKRALDTLYDALVSKKDDLARALYEDLNKSEFEAYMTEIGLTLSDLSHIRKKFPRWAKPRRARPDLTQYPARVRIVPEPYGQALIISPWNYPVLLSLEPLIESIAAGNVVVLKTSPYSAATSRLLAELLEDLFDDGLVSVFRGGRRVNQALLDEAFDYLFFTGSPSLGRIVMEKAAKHLTPLTLELGGKSPCIVEKSADLDLAAKRIAFGKLINAGQTCVAPDYLLVDKSVKDALIPRLQKELAVVLKDRDYFDKNYPRIVNDKHFKRLLALLDHQNILPAGGRIVDEKSRRLSPVLVDEPDPESPLMREEIFGPILPVLSYEKLEEALNFIEKRPRPLALYLFTRDGEVESHITRSLSFGGGAINDCLLHMASSHAPFGGIGQSGFGNYHGRYGFETFSHHKTVMKKGRLFDLSLRYHPYREKDFRLLRRLLK